MGIMRATSLAVLMVPMLLTLPACQTGNKDASDYPRGPERIYFQPQARQVPIQAGEGAYPNLFTGGSHAIWEPGEPVAPQVVVMEVEADESLEAKMDDDVEAVPAKPAPRRGPLTIECELESVFPDRSIAYDAVGLRGMDVYLKLPDGSEVLPVQTALNPELEETPLGALIRYRRTLTLHFPSRNFMVENPAANPGAGGIQLVLTGLNSTFYFEWRAVPDYAARLRAREDHQFRDAVTRGYRAISDRAKSVSHTFD